MDHSSIFSELTDIFADVLDIDDLNLTETTTADDVEEWDSLSHIRLIVSVERHYGIKFSNADIEGLKSVGDLVNLISTKST